ncbi:MAG: hypothetical protein II644_00560 [Paludibacteraceae bacterium]|nr:hypothetical protein [Paludibacteraceae bacterium]
MRNIHFVHVLGTTYMADSELAKYLGVTIRYLRNEIELYNATVIGGNHPSATTPILGAPQSFRVKYKLEFLCFSIPYPTKIQKGTYLLSLTDYALFTFHLSESMRLDNKRTEEQKQALLECYSELRPAFVSAIAENLSHEQVDVINQLRNEQERNGFITGFTIARLLHLDHTRFHDRMYLFYSHSNNSPIIYKQDLNSQKYVMAVNPFDNPLAALGNYGDPTYGFKANDVSALYKVYPQHSDEIGLLEITLYSQC